MITESSNIYRMSRAWSNIQSQTTEKGLKWFDGDYTTSKGVVTVYCDESHCRLDFMHNGKVHVRTFSTDNPPDPRISPMFTKRQIARRCNQLIHDAIAGKLGKVKPYDPFNL